MFLSHVIKRLVDLLAEYVDMLRGVHRVVNSMKDELKIIQPFLKDAEAKLDTVANVDASHVDPRLSSLFIEEDKIVGIDSTAKKLVTSLVEALSTRPVISLVGKGGI
ncbi:hypothetical protein TorRG33x02_294760, partial [Trema orientale]